METKYYECNCGIEGLVVTWHPEDESMEFTIDKFNAQKYPWSWRICNAWRVLTTGDMCKSQICLSKDRVRELRHQINSFLFEKKSKK